MWTKTATSGLFKDEVETFLYLVLPSEVKQKNCWKLKLYKFQHIIRLTRTFQKAAFRAISTAASVDPIDIQHSKEKLASILRGYSAKDIYNDDFTARFHKRRFSLRKEKWIEDKISKEWFTKLHCVSWTGEKEKHVVIGSV